MKKDNIELSIKVESKNFVDLIVGEIWELQGIVYILLSQSISHWSGRVLFWYGLASIILGMVKQLLAKSRDIKELKAELESK